MQWLVALAEQLRRRLEYALNLTDSEYDRATLRALLAAWVFIVVSVVFLAAERMQ
jgi:hypothetical protein